MELQHFDKCFLKNTRYIYIYIYIYIYCQEEVAWRCLGNEDQLKDLEEFFAWVKATIKSVAADLILSIELFNWKERAREWDPKLDTKN